MARMQTARKPGTPKVYVGPSAIHGHGLFAAVEIPQDTVILRVEGESVEEDDPHTLWWTDAKGRERGLRITNEARFVNHAARPNAAFYDLELWSVRRIRRDEEITHDYGEAWQDAYG